LSELFPIYGACGSAEEKCIPGGRHDQERGAGARRKGGPAGGQKEGFHGRVLHRGAQL